MANSPSLRSHLRSVLPAKVADALRATRIFLEGLRLSWMGRRKAFREIYLRNTWGDPDTVSGPGSNLKQTEELRRALPALLAKYNIQSILDVACGDFFWMKEVPLGDVRYVGIDIVPEIVSSNNARYRTGMRNFIEGDIVRDPLPSAELVICKDVFLHFSMRDIGAALGNLKRSGSRYLLTNSYPKCPRNRDITTGMVRPINLQASPFHFPPPSHSIDNGQSPEELFGIWSLAELPF